MTPTADQFANALRSTTARYHDGVMSKPTWSEHMRALWTLVDRAGLRTAVLARVDPAAVGLRPVHDAARR